MSKTLILHRVHSAHAEEGKEEDEDGEEEVHFTLGMGDTLSLVAIYRQKIPPRAVRISNLAVI